MNLTMGRPPESCLPEEDLEEEEEEEEEEEKSCYGDDFATRHDSSTRKGEAGKLDGKKGFANTPRSKHSETEQRRRSKINERFQVLRDLIPQNDQRRDKASFLLEVIEYIHFLQEKVQMYEGLCHQGYSQEPTKLTPWRNNSWTVGGHVEPTQVVRNGRSQENNALVNPGILTAAQNSLQPDIEKAADPLQMQSDTLAPVGRGDLSGSAQQPLPNVADLVSHPQPQWWPAVPFAADYASPNNSENQHEQLGIENGSESISNAYSQGILSTLTKALQSSGVDLSKTSISVQIDVGKQASSRAAGSSSSKDHENHQQSSQAAAHGGYRSYGEESDQQYHKRLRVEHS